MGDDGTDMRQQEALHSGDGEDSLDARNPTTVMLAAAVELPQWTSQVVGATLTVLTGGDAGRIISVGPDGGLLGRGDSVDFAFEDVSISRRHSRLIRQGEYFLLEDLDSLNGTFVNGERIGDVVRLPSNARLQIALHTVLEYAEVDELGALAVEKQSRSMMTDPLTGTGNRLHLDHRLNQEIHYARRHRETLGLLLMDLDHFQNVNDRYGHPAGDRALMAVGDVLLDSVRAEDSVFRYGGEEFCILVRSTNGPGLMVLAERIRAVVEGLELIEREERVPVTLSIGGALLEGGEDGDQQTLVVRADQALYRAKNEGRNCCLLFSPGWSPSGEFTADGDLRQTVE
jgi:diguanylate cyclase (GGDEF)-like protein